MKVVLVHKEFGIYLGNAMGLGFFSLMDCAGQDHACVFDNADQAREHVASWEGEHDQGDYRTVPVNTAGRWATIEELSAAGLEDLTWMMKDERLRNMPAAGRA